MDLVSPVKLASPCENGHIALWVHDGKSKGVGRYCGKEEGLRVVCAGDQMQWEYSVIVWRRRQVAPLWCK